MKKSNLFLKHIKKYIKFFLKINFYTKKKTEFPQKLIILNLQQQQITQNAFKIGLTKNKYLKNKFTKNLSLKKVISVKMFLKSGLSIMH